MLIYYSSVLIVMTTEHLFLLFLHFFLYSPSSFLPSVLPPSPPLSPPPSFLPIFLSLPLPPPSPPSPLTGTRMPTATRIFLAP